MGILKNISSMRDRGELCDVTVVVEKERFHVHKLVLAASSAYFHAMFTSGFQERDKSEIQVIGQKSATFKHFLCHVYSGQVHLTDENIEEIYGIAIYLQAEELIAYCEDYMCNNVNIDNCITYLNLTEDFGQSAIAEKAVEVIARNASFENDPTIFDLKPAMFKKLLQHDKLAQNEEDDLLGHVRLWLSRNDADEETVAELLSEIRWACIDKERLQHYLTDESDDPILGSEVCQSMMQKAIEYWENERMQPVLGGKFSTPRGLPILAAFGGDTGEFIHESVGTGGDDIDVERRFWDDQNIIEPLPLPLHFRECNASVVVNNILFLVGGYSYGYDEDDGGDVVASPHVLKYNPLLNDWRMMSPLSSGRVGHAAVAVTYPDGYPRIMVVGGARHRVGDVPSTEVYDIVKDTWIEQDTFPHQLFAPAACVYNNCVYVSGGRDAHTQCKKYMYRFSPENGQWERLSDMLRVRSGHSMCVVYENIYIVGVQFKSDNEDIYAEMYNPELDQFTKVEWIYPFFAEGNCVSYRERIYRIRGVCSALTLDTRREVVIKNVFFNYSQFNDGSNDSLIEYSTLNSSLAIFHAKNEVLLPDDYEDEEDYIPAIAMADDDVYDILF